MMQIKIGNICILVFMIVPIQVLMYLQLQQVMDGEQPLYMELLSVINNNLIIQWLRGSGTANQTSTHNYPISLKSWYRVVVSDISNTINNMDAVHISNGTNLSRVEILSSHGNRYAIIIGQ